MQKSVEMSFVGASQCVDQSVMIFQAISNVSSLACQICILDYGNVGINGINYYLEQGNDTLIKFMTLGSRWVITGCLQLA